MLIVDFCIVLEKSSGECLVILLRVLSRREFRRSDVTRAMFMCCCDAKTQFARPLYRCALYCYCASAVLFCCCVLVYEYATGTRESLSKHRTVHIDAVQRKTRKQLFTSLTTIVHS